MTRKHFEELSRTIQRLDLGFADRQHVALMLANTFEQWNPPFNRQKWLEACKVN